MKLAADAGERSGLRDVGRGGRPTLGVKVLEEGHSLPAISDDAIVARGGEMKLKELRKSVGEARRKLGRPGLSVFGADGMSVPTLLVAVGDRLPHPVVRLSTAGALRRNGFDVEATLAEYHQSIWTSSYCTDEELERLTSLFGPPISRYNV